MEVVYLSQENRFYVRLTEDACSRLPPGAFSPTISAPVYLVRIEGDGASAATYFLLPAADGAFIWLPIEDCRLARR